jgi:geranylgeranyl pyrophosphate synthase
LSIIENLDKHIYNQNQNLFYLMGLNTYLQQATARINEALGLFSSAITQEISGVSPKLQPLVALLNEASEGGKRLRAVLVLLGYEIASKEQKAFNPAILAPALAFELFQTAILAHDDIIDKSPTRRGKPTLYKQLENTQNNPHYGISQAICLGDIGMFLAVRLVATSDFEPTNRLKAVNAFLTTLIYTGVGEMLDVELPYLHEKQHHEEDILAIYLHKTAHYTITGAMQLGAILAGADENYLQDLATFGNNLGIAFQIQDDILGIFGNEADTGKSAVSDIEEGKITLLYSKAKERANAEQQAILAQYYGKGAIEATAAEKVRQVFKATQALVYAESQKEKYRQQAVESIQKLTQRADDQEILQQFASFMINRKS